MQLHCPSCNATIHSDDINLDLMSAKCRQCHAVMNVTLPDEDDGADDDLDDGTEDEELGAAPAVERADVPMPPEFRVRKSDVELRIVYRWWDATVFGVVVFFCGVWSGLVYWLMTTNLNFAKEFSGTIILPVAGIGIGLAAAYLALAMLVNRTIISADADRLQVKQGPLPWRGNRGIATDQVKQLYCRGEEGTVRYEVYVVTVDHGHVKLLGALIDKGMALFVEQQVERFLNIPDRVVAGELRR